MRLDFDAERRDVYGRLLAYVYLGDRFVNAELVERGYATHADDRAQRPLRRTASPSSSARRRAQGAGSGASASGR